MTRRNALGWACVAACAVAAAHVLWLPRIIVDDAFISYRYARNLIEGRGLVFNVGEPVEGYSNLLWVLLTSAGLQLLPDPEGITRALGAVAALGSVGICVAIVRRVTSSILPAVCGGLVLAFSTSFCSSAVNGLETGLYGFLITSAIFHAICNRRITASLLGGLAALTRPEGIVIAGCLGLVGVWTDDSEKLCRRACHWWGPCVIAWLAAMVFRWSYYGALVPNSVVAKSVLPAILVQTPITHWFAVVFNRPGVEYVAGFIHATFGLLVALSLVPIFASSSRRRAGLLLIAPPMLGISICVTNFGDWMTSYRLLTPYLPVLCAAVVWGASIIATQIFGRANSRRLLQGGMLICLTAFWIRNGFQTERPSVTHNPDAELGWMLRSSGQRDLIAATDVLGRMGYFAGCIPIVDMAGLADAHIARHGEPRPPLGRSDFEYVLRRKPHLIMNNVRAAWKRHARHRSLRDDYLWVDRSPWTHGDEWGGVPRFILVKRGTILEAEMRGRYRDAVWRRVEELPQD